MSDLISKSALIEEIKKRSEYYLEDWDSFRKYTGGRAEESYAHFKEDKAIIKIANNLPTVEQVRGEWIEGDTYYNSCGVRLIDADAERDGFMEMVYEQLSDDPDNIRANLIIDYYDSLPTVELPVRGEWIYWKEQCEYCMNRSACPYPENQESMESLKKWEKENKFWGSLKLICDYYVLDKDKYYLDNPPECNAER